MRKVILLALAIPLLFVSCGIARSSKSIKKANALQQKAVRALANYVENDLIIQKGVRQTVKPTAFLLVKDLEKRHVFVAYYKGESLLAESYRFASNAGYDYAVRLGDMASKEFEQVLQQTATPVKTKIVVPVQKTPPPAKKAEVKPTPPPVKKAEAKPTPPPVKKAEPQPTPPPVKKAEPQPTPPPVKKAEPQPTPPPVKKAKPTPPPAKKEEKKTEPKKDDKKAGDKKEEKKTEKKKDEKEKVDYFKLYQKYRKEDPEKGGSK